MDFGPEWIPWIPGMDFPIGGGTTPIEKSQHRVKRGREQGRAQCFLMGPIPGKHPFLVLITFGVLGPG